MNTKQALIDLGNAHPELRADLKPVIAHLASGEDMVTDKKANAMGKIRELGSQLKAGGSKFVVAVTKQDSDEMRRQAYLMTYAMGVMFSVLGRKEEATLLKRVAASLR